MSKSGPLIGIVDNEIASVRALRHSLVAHG
jgi:hypothetical protein